MTDLKEPGRAEAEAQRITESSDAELREYIHRGLTERWLSGVVRRLNRLEQRPATTNLARWAFPGERITKKNNPAANRTRLLARYVDTSTTCLSA